MFQKDFDLLLDNKNPQYFLAELTKLLKKIQSMTNAAGERLYIHLLFRKTDQKVAQAARDTIRKHLPQAVVTGMSETLFGENRGLSSLKINITSFSASRLHLFEYIGCPGKNYTVEGERIGKLIQNIEDAKAIAVYCSGVTTDFHSFISSLSSLNQDKVLFGATAGMFEYSAGDPDKCTDLFTFNQNNLESQQFVIGTDMYDVGIVVAVFAGSELQVRGDYILGWKPLGKEMTVTEILSDNCIAKLDDMPATEIYHRYLKVSPDENFVFNITEFPLVCERNGCLIARVPPRYDEDGRLYFSSDVYPGEKIRLSYAVHEDLLQETEHASEYMGSFAPSAVFLTICGNRTIFLGEKAGLEQDYYRRFANDLVCNYGTSEIFCYQGKGGLLNSAFVAIGMREGKAAPTPYYNALLKQCTSSEHRIIPLAERMATFLDAMSQELTDMARRANAASIAKSQFLSSMSHEIRTPINAILGMNEMILRETNEPQIREYAENIRTASTTLLSLVNDILDFSKIEAGKLELIPVEYTTSSLLNDLVNMIRQRAEKKGLDFHIEAPQDLPSVLKGDEIRLRQIVTNILTNAVKYTEHGSVTLALAWKQKNDKKIYLRFSVKDTGIGIKPEDIDRLFHPFERIEEERNRSIEGTGLGMNITQRLLKLMDSQLEVDSVYGKGSTFSFTLEQDVLNFQPMGNYEEAYRHSLTTQENYQESFLAPKAKILVTDDTAMNLTVIKGLLKQTKLQITTAVSGYECLNFAAKEHFDIIFLDHRMPGIDGMETLARLQKLQQDKDFPNARTPIIALTANAVSGAREEYLAAGFDDYLTKPIDSHKLEAAICHYLPPEKISYTAAQKKAAAAETLPAWLETFKDLDTAKGIQNCGSVAAYLDALTIFAKSIESNAAEIQRYFETKECKNYTTKVHALKSTARIIGASELAEKARRLEDAGNNGYIDEIKTNTEPMLTLYRSFTDLLTYLAPDKKNTPKEPIDPLELAEAWLAVREAVAAFDDDSLQYLLTELANYQLPDAEEAKLEKISQAAEKLDWENLQKLTSQ